MPTVFLAPLFGAGAQFFNNQGAVLAGGQLFSYVAGSVSTPQSTYIDNTGTATNAFPIVLDSAGRLPAGVEVWIAAATKFVLKDASNNTIGSWDNVVGINDVPTVAQVEYIVSGLAPTFATGTQFTAQGNQTAVFDVDRRVRYKLAGGTFYGYVTSNSFDGINTTTVNIHPDSTNLDATLFQMDYSFLDAINPSVPEQYVRQGHPFNWCGTAGGTANALALTPVVPGLPVLEYLAGMLLRFKSGASANTGATTAAVSGLGTVAVQLNGAALTGGEIQPNTFYELYLDSTTTAQLSQVSATVGAFSSFGPTVVLSSASTVNIGAAKSNNVDISGSVTVTAFDTVAEGVLRVVRYTGAVPITYNASTMQLLGGKSRTNSNGDQSVFKSLGGGNWKEIFYQPVGGSVPLLQNSQSTNYTTTAQDANNQVFHPAADNNPRTFTIDSNANVPYPVGTTLTFINEINVLTIAITSDTLAWSPSGGTGSRILAANGMATAVKVTSTKWFISGSGLT